MALTIILFDCLTKQVGEMGTHHPLFFTFGWGLGKFIDTPTLVVSIFFYHHFFNKPKPLLFAQHFIVFSFWYLIFDIFN